MHANIRIESDSSDYYNVHLRIASWPGGVYDDAMCNV